MTTESAMAVEHLKEAIQFIDDFLLRAHEGRALDTADLPHLSPTVTAFLIEEVRQLPGNQKPRTGASQETEAVN